MKPFTASKQWLAAASLGLFLLAKPDISGFAAGVESNETEQLASAHWEQREDGLYYYQSDGSPAAGWTWIDTTYFYMTEAGRCLMNCITPDGYYVNPDGSWLPRSTVILEHPFQAPQKIAFQADTWPDEEGMKNLQTQIADLFREKRIRITNSSIEYLKGENEQVLLGIYKNTETNSYRMDIRMTLDKNSTAPDQAATYDYAVFRAFLYQLSTTPDYLEDAIYSSWKEDNRWNINRTEAVWVGDSQVKYMAGIGCGYYYIYPAGEM